MSAHSHIAFVQFFKGILGKNIGDKPKIIVILNKPLIADCNAAAFLSAVLKSVKSKIGLRSYIVVWVIGIYAKNSAFFLKIAGHSYSPNSRLRISL